MLISPGRKLTPRCPTAPAYVSTSSTWSFLDPRLPQIQSSGAGKWQGGGVLGSYRGGSNSSEHRNPKGRDLFALVVVTRAKHVGLGVGDGVMFLSRRAVAALLWVRYGPSATH